MLSRVFASDPIFIHLFSPDESGFQLRLVCRLLNSASAKVWC